MRIFLLIAVVWPPLLSIILLTKKTFRNSSYLNTHRYAFSYRWKPFRCSFIINEKTFSHTTYTSILNTRIMHSPTGENPFLNMKNEKKYSIKIDSKLDTHMRIYTGKKPFISNIVNWSYVCVLIYRWKTICVWCMWKNIYRQ